MVLLYLESIGNPRKFSRIARRVSRRKPIVAVRSGRSSQGVPMGHAVRKISAPAEAVDAMFRQAGIIQVESLEEMFDVAQLLAHQPLPRGRRVAIVGNSDALGLLAADAANSVGLVVNKQVALGADATAEDFEDALDAAIDDPDVDSVVAIFIPPLNVAGAREDVANVLAAVGEQSDKPIVSTFLGTEGVPELLRVPDVAGSSAGRGSVPSYPEVEAAVRALARVVEYAVWLRVPQPSGHEPGVVDRDAARHLVNEVLMRDPEGRELDFREQHRLLDAYGIHLWETYAVESLDEAVAAGEELGWDVVLKATADHLRDRPDLAHVWRNIDTPAEMEDAWATLNQLITDPARAGFVVQRNAPPGVPVTIATMEDPLFGPVLSFGIGGPLTELLGDRSYRIPRWPTTTRRTWSARSRPRRCSSATAAARSSTSRRSSAWCVRSRSCSTTCRRCGRCSCRWSWPGRTGPRCSGRRAGGAGEGPPVRLVRAANCPRCRGTRSPTERTRDRLLPWPAPPVTRTSPATSARRSTAPATTPRSSPTASSPQPGARTSSRSSCTTRRRSTTRRCDGT